MGINPTIELALLSLCCLWCFGQLSAFLEVENRPLLVIFLRGCWLAFGALALFGAFTAGRLWP